MEKEKECVNVGDLKKILEKYADDLPLILTHDGKGHQYGIKFGDIFKTTNPYFGNDSIADEEIGDEDYFLNLGII